MSDLEGPLLSLRNDLHIAVGRFIDDNERAERARRSILKINNFLAGEDVTGTNDQVTDIRTSSEQLAPVTAGQNGKFDNAMASVEAALGGL